MQSPSLRISQHRTNSKLQGSHCVCERGKHCPKCVYGYLYNFLQICQGSSQINLLFVTFSCQRFLMNIQLMNISLKTVPLETSQVAQNVCLTSKSSTFNTQYTLCFCLLVTVTKYIHKLKWHTEAISWPLHWLPGNVRPSTPQAPVQPVKAVTVKSMMRNVLDVVKPGVWKKLEAGDAYYIF